MEGELLHLSGGVWSLNGSEELLDKLSCSLKDGSDSEKDETCPPPAKMVKKNTEDFCGLVPPSSCEAKLRVSYELGANLASQLLAKGAKRVLDEAKSANLQPVNVPPPKKSMQD